jgi:hypothetical protein
MSNLINPTTNTTPIRSNTAAAPLGAAPLAATPGLMSGATTPSLSNTAAAPLGAAPLGASPLGAAPLGGTTATTMLPPTGTGLMGHHDNKHLSKQERKALKHQNKALKHDHHNHGHGLTGTGLPLAAGATRGTGLGTVMHGATNVVQHQPIVEREVIVERPVEMRREHHIQPVVHERERQIQPIVRTEVTTERKDLVTVRTPLSFSSGVRPSITNEQSNTRIQTGPECDDAGSGRAAAPRVHGPDHG